MDRRNFGKQVLAVAAGAAASDAMSEQPPDKRSYESATISVQLLEERPGVTSVILAEHGDADQVIVEAFYWTTYRGLRVMLHKEATAPVSKGVMTAAELQMPVTSIVFLRVKELKMLGQSEFGDVPKK